MRPILIVKSSVSSIADSFETSVTLTLSTANLALSLSADDKINCTFPSDWIISLKTSSIANNWSYQDNTLTNSDTKTISATQTTEIHFKIQAKKPGNVKVHFQAFNKKKKYPPLSTNAQVHFSVYSSTTDYLIASISKGHYLNSNPDSIIFSNSLKSFFIISNCKAPTLQPEISVSFYSYDKYGNPTQLTIDSPDFTITLKQTSPGGSNTYQGSSIDQQTWTFKNVILSTTDEETHISMTKLSDLISGVTLEARYKLSNASSDGSTYTTSSFFSIAGPYTLTVGLNQESNSATSTDTSQFYLSGTPSDNYELGTWSTFNLVPLSFFVYDENNNQISPESFEGSILLNKQAISSNSVALVPGSNSVSLQVGTGGSPYIKTEMNFLIGENASLPTGWRSFNNNTLLIGAGQNLSELSSLAGLDLSSMNLSHANFSGADLTNTNLSGSNLINSNFSSTTLTNTNFSYAIMNNISSGGITGIPVLPPRWQVIKGHLVGAYANLMNADLSSANLIGVNLTGANLLNATIAATQFYNIIENRYYSTQLDYVISGNLQGIPNGYLKDWTLINGYLVGPNANLQDADFSEQVLSEANLTCANLQGAILDNTTFSDSTVLDYVISGGVSGTPQNLPSNWQLINGYLVGPNANLNNANLSAASLCGQENGNLLLTGTQFIGANLTNASFSYVDLTDANLSNADLSNATLSNITSANIVSNNGTVLPAGWKIENGKLVQG